MNKKKKQYSALYIIWLILCLVPTIFFFGPLVWIILTAFKPMNEVLTYPPVLFPSHWTLDNFRLAWQAMDWTRMIFNSIILTSSITILTIFFNAMAGFAFAKLRFPLREPLFMLVLATMMIPIQVPLVPRFLMMVRIGLVNSMAPVILLAIAQGFHVFLFRQFFISLPDELFQAATIDGASFWKCFWAIALPLSKPVTAALIIITFLREWNNYLYPLIYLTNPKLFTTQIGLALFRIAYPMRFGPLMAAALFVAIPTIAIYLLMQRYFTKGIIMTGIKG